MKFSVNKVNHQQSVETQVDSNFDSRRIVIKIIACRKIVVNIFYCSSMLNILSECELKLLKLSIENK